MNSRSCVKSLSISSTCPICYHISKHQFITVNSVLINTSPSSLTVRSTHSSVPAPPFLPSHPQHIHFSLILPALSTDLFFILSESPSPEQQLLHDNLSHNPACYHLLFPVIFGSILFSSCDRILHHSERINRVFLRIFR